MSHKLACLQLHHQDGLGAKHLNGINHGYRITPERKGQSHFFLEPFSTVLSIPWKDTSKPHTLQVSHSTQSLL